jgi:hypothetical protein
MQYVVRVWLPDRPGALGQVASRIGSVGGDVVGIDILERGAGRAVDELVVELADESVLGLLAREIGDVDGVDVEQVRPAGAGGHDPRVDALETAAILVGASAVDALLDALCSHGTRLLGASWAAVLQPDSGEVVAATGETPGPAWLAAFVTGSRSSGALLVDDVVWAPLPASALAFVCGREGTTFRARERRQAAALARIVDRRARELNLLSRARHPTARGSGGAFPAA